VVAGPGSKASPAAAVAVLLSQEPLSNALVALTGPSFALGGLLGSLFDAALLALERRRDGLVAGGVQALLGRLGTLLVGVLVVVALGAATVALRARGVRPCEGVVHLRPGVIDLGLRARHVGVSPLPLISLAAGLLGERALLVSARSRGCGAAGSKDYATPAAARRYAAALCREDRETIGRRAPLVGLLPLRLARAWRDRRS
jgi:hypothetical protein